MSLNIVAATTQVPEEWQARTLLWEAAWASRDSNEEVSRAAAIAWLTTNLESILDLPAPHELVEFVAHEVRLPVPLSWRGRC